MDPDSDIDLRSWTFSGPKERAYEVSRRPVLAIVGPTGGGKSTGSARRCLRVATWQNPSPRDGVRKARTVCICPTYRRAWDTVMPSYFKVFPQTLGTFRGSRGDPADHIFETDVMMGGERSRLHVEVLFRAVNDLDLEEFFRGLETTAFWLPEMDTNADLASMLSLATNRVGRYPEPEDRPFDGPAAYAGVFGDANAPMIGTDFHTRFYLKLMPSGERAPESDLLVPQPGGFSPNAENMANLRRIRPDYYEHMASQLDPYDIQRLVNNRPAYGRHGQPVHPNFDQEIHVATRNIDVDPFSPVFIGIDAGSNTLRPAAAFMQKAYSGQWRVGAEIHADIQRNNDEFAAAIRATLNSRYPNLSRDNGALLCLDPAAAGKNAMSEYTTAMALQALCEIEARIAPTNRPDHRRTALDKLFLNNVAPREPGIIIDPRCVGLIGGLAGGFHYPRRGNVVGLTPAKNNYSHVCEAAEYAPLTVDGLDARQGRFIRPDGGGDYDGPRVIYEG